VLKGTIVKNFQQERRLRNLKENNEVALQTVMDSKKMLIKKYN